MSRVQITILAYNNLLKAIAWAHERRRDWTAETHDPGWAFSTYLERTESIKSDFKEFYQPERLKVLK